MASRSTFEALFPSVLGRVLTFLFAEAQGPVHVAEVIRQVDSGTGAVHRVLQRLEAAGLLAVDRVGNMKLYRPNRSHPIYLELARLVRKTTGIAAPLMEALEPLASRIDEAFVFGSVASGEETPDSDIDLMILSDRLSYAEIFEVLPSAEAEIGRSINPHLESSASWREKVSAGDSFAASVEEGPRIFVLSSEDVPR